MAAREAQSITETSEPRRLALPLLAARSAGRDYTWMTFQAPPDWVSRAGQFVNVFCESDARALAASDGRAVEWPEGTWPETTGIELARRWPVVRRPFSIARTRPRETHVELELLVRGVGKGSAYLRARPVGSAVDVVGPLGTHFTPPADERRCLLVGGGCGMAPIFALADELADAGRRCLCFFGCRTAEEMPTRFRVAPAPSGDDVEPTAAVEEFTRDGILTVLATDDGSAGYAGTSVAALERWLDDSGDDAPVALYGCGPDAMLRALAAVAEARLLPCQVSIERWMGCGAGLCLSCAHKRRDPRRPEGWTYKLACRDGPVVDARDLVWEEP